MRSNDITFTQVIRTTGIDLMISASAILIVGMIFVMLPTQANANFANFVLGITSIIYVFGISLIISSFKLDKIENMHLH